MRRASGLVAVSLFVALVGCQGMDQGTSGGPSGQTLGTIGGGALGALAGSQVGSGTGKLAATAAGTLLGAVVGRELGARLSQRDQAEAMRAESRALADNTTVTWTNPETAHSGSVTPLRTYSQNGRYCREYAHTVFIEGRAQEARGTACRAGDGSWQIVG